MIKPLRHTIAPTPKNRIKALVEDLLRTRAENPDKTVSDRGLTIGEIVRGLDWDKTRNGDVSATLHKLRDEGKVRTQTVPATSRRGPRFVKCYRWHGPKATPQPTPTPAPLDDRRFLSLCR